MTVFFRFSIHFILLTTWWLLFCKKLHETLGSQSKFNGIKYINLIYVYLIYYIILYYIIYNFLDYLPNSSRWTCKNRRSNNIICRLLQSLWLHTRMEEGVNTTRLRPTQRNRLYKNMKVKIYSPDGDTDYFNIVAGVLQGDTLAPYLFIIYVLRKSIDKMKDNGFKLTKERSRRYLAQTCRWHSAFGKYTQPSRNSAT